VSTSGSRCPSCEGELVKQILHWPSIPVNASLFPATREESLAVPRGSFRLVGCLTCGLLFNADHDEELVEYSGSCIETQAHSERHRAFADELARGWIDRHGLKAASVVEVGSGFDAGFLRRLLDLGGGTGVGIDPALPATSEDGRLTFLAERFTTAHADIPGRALVCRHTLEHIPRVAAFLHAVRSWSTANADAPVLFEVPDTGRILAEGAFWDVYYEHCSYFTDATLAATFRVHGFEPERLEEAYDGQYLVLEARPAPPAPPDASLAAAVVDSAVAFAKATDAKIERAAQVLRALRPEGPIVIWQAGGKALALLTLTGAEEAVSGVVDANPSKRGRYLPGTSYEILGPEDVRALGPRYIVLMNRVYVAEVERSLASLGVDSTVLPAERLFD
jgi:C-methyltransferase C-terminal domain